MKGTSRRRLRLENHASERSLEQISRQLAKLRNPDGFITRVDKYAAIRLIETPSLTEWPVGGSGAAPGLWQEGWRYREIHI